MGTREKIIKAALELFSKKGYWGATTKEIARSADLAEVTLFRHFPSKEILFGEVVSTQSFLPELKLLLPEIKKRPYEEALATIAGRFLETLEARKDLIRIMHSEMHNYPNEIKKIYHGFIDDIFKSLAAYFKEMQEAGVLREFDPEMGARAFLGMFFSHFTSQEFLLHKKYRAVDPEAVIKNFSGIFVNGTLKRV